MQYGKPTVLFVSRVANCLMCQTDQETNEIVFTCVYCGAELRGSVETLTGHVTFKHEPECPWFREFEREENITRNASNKLMGARECE